MQTELSALQYRIMELPLYCRRGEGVNSVVDQIALHIAILPLTSQKHLVKCGIACATPRRRWDSSRC